MVKTECFKAVLLNIVMLGIAAAEEIHLSMVKRMVAGFARKIAIKIAKIL